ncbi:hypothetical protein [Chryseobacterium turcicum]|uniref:Uncharacterized protein n=1 Tax=Chryseobacterium turcicum TaxID=2898076 RepID=A0A9Q3V4L2_9FLAO|nr:hypothetical protein [Chryseobacterium turcicum]MCD1117156.1 hypothetical protein [Chryseobacterium turcicum]
MKNRFYKIISWVSVIIPILFFILLIKELIFEELSLFEIALTPFVLGGILLIDFFVSFYILKQKIKSNITILLFQLIIIIFCTYQTYYYNSAMSKKVDHVISP